MEEKDEDAICELVSDNDRNRRMGSDYVTGREEALSRFRQFLQDRNDQYVLEERSGGRVIGNISLEPLMPRMPELEGKKGRSLSYSLLPAWRRQGLMSEALAAMCAFLFEKEGLDCVNCGYFVFNTPSGELQKKLGFEFLSRTTVVRIGEEFQAIDNILWNPARRRQW